MDINYDEMVDYYEYVGFGDNIGRQPVDSNASALLASSNFSRSGYGFQSWNTAEDGTGTDYGPNQSINTGNLSHVGLNLYAKWVPAETSVTMQTFDSTISPYSSAAIGTVIGLRDARDNNVYAVAKLADGKWWMIENLRLDIAVITTVFKNINETITSVG